MQFIIIIIIIYFKAQTLPPQTFGSGSVPDRCHGEVLILAILKKNLENLKY